MINENYQGSFKALVDDNFSEGKLGILPWKNLTDKDYVVTVGLVQDESTYNEDGRWYHAFDQKIINGQIYLPDELTPRPTKITNKVYIICCPSDEVGKKHFQEITRYGDSNVKVLVDWCGPEEGWKASGFK